MDLAAENRELKRRLALLEEASRDRGAIDGHSTSTEKEYRSLFLTMGHGYSELELIRGDDGQVIDYRHIALNPAFERLTGLSIPQTVGRTAREVLHHLEPWWLETYERIAASGQPERLEYPVASLDRWYEVHVYPRGGDRLSVLYEDISVRKGAEQALQTLEERQRFLLKLSDAIRTLADAGEIQAIAARLLGEHLDVDRAMYGEVTGEPGAEVGRIRGQFVRPATPNRLAPTPFPDQFTFESFGVAVMARRYSGEGLVVADVDADPAFDTDERAAWAMAGVRAAIVAPLIKDGRLIAEIGVHSETPRTWTDAEVSLVHEVGERTWAAAERARSETTLHESEEKYRGLFESIDEGFSIVEVLYDDAGKPCDAVHLEANPAHARHSGLEGIVGKRVFEVLPADEARYWVAFYEEVIRTGQASRIESEITGIGRWVAVHVSRLGGAGSRKVVVIFNDTTERKLAEIALRESELRQTFFLELGDALRSVSTADEKIAAAARALGERLNASRVLWGEYDWKRKEAHIFGGWLAEGAQSFPTLMQLEDYDGEVLRALRAGRTVRIDNVGLLVDEPAYAAIADVGVQALLSIPLIIDGILKVNISIHQHEPRRWTDQEVAVVREVAERLWAEVVRARTEGALRESGERFRQFAEAAAEGAWIRDVNTLNLEYASPAAHRIYGVVPGAFVDGVQYWASLILPEDRDAVLAHLEDSRQGKVVTHEFRIRRPSDGAFRWIRSINFPLLDAQGRVQRIGALDEDFTEVKLAVEHQGVLLAELQHRVRNIMAMIRSMARRSAAGAVHVDEYRDLLEGRLVALSRVQALLTRQDNTGGFLRNIVESEVSAQAHHGGQFELVGPDVQLSPKAAEVLTLALHELATNALKYGALSVPDGRLRVEWVPFERQGQTWLAIDWTEAGAPSRGPGTRRGFGSELIEGRIPYELDGIGKINIEPNGARARLEFPLTDGESILETDAPKPTSMFGGRLDMTGAPDLTGRSVLVVEDDYYTASDTAAALSGAGATVLGPCPSEAKTLALLETVTPTHAVLDLNLGGGGPRFEVARALRAKGVPFIFLTGYDPDVVPPDLSAVVRLQKPVRFLAIVEAVAQLT